MRKKTTIWLITAAVLVLIGGMILGGLMSKLNWNFRKLSTSKYETNRYEINEKFSNISVETDTAEVIFAVSNDGKCKVECYEEERSKHRVTVAGDTLVIGLIDERSWYNYIGINFGSPKITVYLPEGEYATLSIREDTGDVEIPKDFAFKDVDISLRTGDVDLCASASGPIKIKGSTGDICVENISAGSLELSVSTGKVIASGVKCEGDVTVGVSTGKAYLTDIKCQNVISRGSTGDISLDHVIAAEKFSVERSTGDVKFTDCDAAEIYVETDTGKVTGSLLTDKVFITRTDTGTVDVPRTVTGGRCEITTDTGNIKITVK